MLKARFVALVIALILLVSVTGVLAQEQTIVEIAAGNADFSTLVELVTAAGLADTLSGEGPFTVFAPTNEAFAKLPASVVDYLKSDSELLTRVLTYHVIAGEVMAADVSTMMAATVEGSELDIRVDGMGVTVNGVHVTSTDIKASNGVIHVVDGVLVPPVELPEVDPLSVTGPIIAAGSSTVYPLAEAVAKSFTNDGYADQITIDSIGTGGGFERFCKTGETDIANASRAIRQEERDNCTAIGRTPIEIRVGTDALAVVVNPKNPFLTGGLTFAQLALVFSDPRNEDGTVARQRTWQDVNPEWPAEPIQRFIPGTDSGTFDYFVEAIFLPIYNEQKKSGVAADPFIAKDFEGDGAGAKVAILNSTHQASEDDNVLVQGVEGSEYAIGYFGYAYYEKEGSKLSILPLAKAPDGEPVAASAATVDANTYPLARPLFIYTDAKIMAAKPQVAAFVNYFLTNVNDLIGNVGYFPANDNALNLARLEFLAATSSGM